MSSRADDATIAASRGDALLVEVDAYVRALQGDYARASRAERARFGALTLERLLQRVWQHFYADSSRRGVARVLPDTLPFALAAVPALADVAALQARVTARVVAAVATRPLVTLHELEQELCVSEGVTCYDDLGLGPRLSCLPVVQQFFQVRSDTPVARVTSAQVLAFALATRACDDDDNDDKDDHSTCDGDSRRHDDVAFVHGNGDARDLVNAFARHYEATQQQRRQQQDDENVSAHGAQTRRGPRRAARLTSNRQLGIHIQSFARFTNLLQQESGQARLTLRNAIATAQARLTQNAPLYRATIAALDAALRDVLVHNNDNNNAAAQTSLSFAVPMSEAAARRTTVPLTCWTASSNASRSAAAAVHAARGGLCLPICIGHAATTTTTTRALPPPHAAAATPPTSTTTPVAPAVPQRHRLRGCTIRDTAACIVAATDCVAATMPIAAVAAAPSAQTTTTTQIAAADGVATTTANAPRASTDAALEQWLVTAMTCNNDNSNENSDDTDTSDGAAVARVEQAIDVLSSVVVGSRLRVALVRRVFAQLAAMATARRAVTSLLRACAATPLLPLPHPHYTRVYNNDNDNNNKKSSSNDDDDEYWDVVYVASAEEVCWLPLAQHDDDDDDDGNASRPPVIFCTALAPLYGDALRAFFCDVCGVAVHAHLACWWACAAIARRRYSADLLRTSLSSSSSFVQRYMNTFARCVLSDYRARVAALLLQQQTTTHNNDNDNDNDDDNDDEDGRVARLAAAGKRALQQLCASVPAGVASEVHWLPCDRAGWCRAVDGVLYCTPQHYSVSGCRLVTTRSHHEDDDDADDDACSAATSEQPPPRLLLLLLTAEPHMAVAAVLQRCGVRALSAWVRTTVCYSSLTPDRDVVADVAMLHRCVAALLPYVLALLARDDAVVYALTRCHGNDNDAAATTMTSGGGGGLLRRLAQLRVLYGDGVTRTEQLCSSSGSSNAVCYTSRQTVRLCYVAAHHTLYSAAESCTPRVLAHALLPLFLPYAPTRAVQTRLLALLSDTAAVVLGTANNSNNISSAMTTAPDVRGHAFTSASCDVSPSLVRALDAVAQRQHGVVVSRALRRAAHAMGVAAPPSTRPQSRFPPGCDGFANPPLQHHSSNSSRRSSSHGGYTSSHAGAAAATSSAAVVLCGRGRPGVDAWCVRSLPQWTDDDGGCGASVHAELQALLSQPLSSSSSQVQQQPPPPSHASTRPRRTHARIDLCGGDDNDVVAALSADDDDDDDDGIVRFASSSSLSPRKRARDVATGYGNDDGGTTTPYTTLPAFVASDLGGGNSSNGGGGDGGARASAVAAERFVYEQLCREYADDAEVRVMWLNEASESGTPYDIVVARYTATTAATTSHAQRPPQTPQVLQLVEVKSTTSRQRRDFELSPRELVTAARYGAAYAIYRVFAASAHSPQHMRVRVYRDVLQQWYTGRLSISGELRVLPTS